MHRNKVCCGSRPPPPASGVVRLSCFAHPCFPEDSLPRHKNSSRLLLDMEPYYNPVNLEKAKTCVKQKEFLDGIEKPGRRPAAAHFRSCRASGHFLFGAARLGSPGTGISATHGEPLPDVYGSGRAPAAASAFPAARAGVESGGHRARFEKARRGRGARRGIATPGPTLPQVAVAAQAFLGPGRECNRRIRGIPEFAGARADALLDRIAAPDRTFLQDEHHFAVRNQWRRAA